MLLAGKAGETNRRGHAVSSYLDDVMIRILIRNHSRHRPCMNCVARGKRSAAAKEVAAMGLQWSLPAGDRFERKNNRSTVNQPSPTKQASLSRSRVMMRATGNVENCPGDRGSFLH